MKVRPRIHQQRISSTGGMLDPSRVSGLRRVLRHAPGGGERAEERRQ